MRKILEFLTVFVTLALLQPSRALADIRVGDHVFMPYTDGSFTVGKIKHNGNGTLHIELIDGGERDVRTQEIIEMNPKGSMNSLMNLSKKEQVEFEGVLFGRLDAPGKWQSYLKQECDKLPDPERKAVKRTEEIKAYWTKIQSGHPLTDALLELESNIRIADSNPETKLATAVYKKLQGRLEEISKVIQKAHDVVESKQKDDEAESIHRAQKLFADRDRANQAVKDAQTYADSIRRQIEDTSDKNKTGSETANGLGTGSSSGSGMNSNPNTNAHTAHSPSSTRHVASALNHHTPSTPTRSLASVHTSGAVATKKSAIPAPSALTPPPSTPADATPPPPTFDDVPPPPPEE